MRGLAFNRAASGFTQVTLVAAAAGPSDGELMIETDGDNLGASHICQRRSRRARPSGCPRCGCSVFSTRPASRRVDALKIDVEGYEDRVLTGFFKQAPQALWPRAVVIEHLSRNEWLRRLHCRHARARLRRDRQDPQQHAIGARAEPVRQTAGDLR